MTFLVSLSVTSYFFTSLFHVLALSSFLKDNPSSS